MPLCLDPFLDKYKFDVEDVEAATAEMICGKAAGLDELTTEHIVHSHPVLLVILAKLFNIIMSAGYVPYGFRLSYTVPLPKVDTISSANVVHNYRAISISPILSKIFEQCIFNKYIECGYGPVAPSMSLRRCGRQSRGY